MNHPQQSLHRRRPQAILKGSHSLIHEYFGTLQTVLSLNSCVFQTLDEDFALRRRHHVKGQWLAIVNIWFPVVAPVIFRAAKPHSLVDGILYAALVQNTEPLGMVKPQTWRWEKPHRRSTLLGLLRQSTSRPCLVHGHTAWLLWPASQCGAALESGPINK